MERIRDRPANRDRLMQADPARFIAAMSHWSGYFSDDADKPVIGASEEWVAKQDELAALFAGFLRRVQSRASA